ncbi:prenyltransferase/squalene oxidase repeat-containing protein [Luteolibacter marinus]|uniref:prenyltransferase/squalene oxidase repeat-containing protein n=1 Tax=Luteolibacter marinus TaxID=2776705 RepID=UPI001866B77E|nr:prenyltransferase/squalene oxidase repeat-containing protein [Luteolibacter marinus]
MSRLLPCLILGAALAPLAAQNLPRRPDDPVPAQVDTMYERGLAYLAKSQNDRGSWDDSMGGEPGVVGLCVVAFLAHGEDPNHGVYAKQISKGIDYILSQQNSTNGYIGNSMYNHGFATLALAEAYGMVDNLKIAPALEKAVELILSAQKRNRSEAWRYTPDSTDADTTVSGCQIVALFAARNAGLAVPNDALKKGLAYLARCRGGDGGYGYTSAGGPKPTLTAIGVLCLSLAKEKDGKGFQTSVDYLRKQLSYRDRHYPYYFEYYMSQALFHAHPETWEEWNSRNIRYLSTIQSRDGSWPGNKGQSFNTAGALLSLALNYRFLPIYEK